jgi:hypothetical protein
LVYVVRELDAGTLTVPQLQAIIRGSNAFETIEAALRKMKT